MHKINNTNPTHMQGLIGKIYARLDFKLGAQTTEPSPVYVLLGLDNVKHPDICLLHITVTDRVSTITCTDI